MLWKECVDGLPCWLPHTLSNEASLWLHSHLIQARMTIAAKFISPPNTNTHIHSDSYGCRNGTCHQCSGGKKMENCFRTDRSDAAASDASSDFSKPNVSTRMENISVRLQWQQVLVITSVLSYIYQTHQTFLRLNQRILNCTIWTKVRILPS